jgi:RHS repeat-associated protein
MDSGGTTKFVWDGDNILLETDASNVTQAVYSRTPAQYGPLISQRRGLATSFYHFDALGSTVQLTNNAGSSTDLYLYDSYGSLVFATQSSPNAYRFVGLFGYYFDVDSSDYYVRARWLSPMLSRFLTPDPLLFANINLIQRYSYSQHNPLSYFDPTGNQVDLYAVPSGGCNQTGCSRASLRASFLLAIPLGTKPGAIQGAVVQHVHVTENLRDCRGRALPATIPPPSNDYFEGWKVVAGLLRPSSPMADSDNWNDEFFYCDHPNTCGSLDIVGEAAFLPNYVFKYQSGNDIWIQGKPDLKIPPGIDPCSKRGMDLANKAGLGPWGRLPHKFSAPVGWNAAAKSVHSLHIEWNCCEACGAQIHVDGCPDRPGRPICTFDGSTM